MQCDRVPQKASCRAQHSRGLKVSNPPHCRPGLGLRAAPDQAPAQPRNRFLRRDPDQLTPRGATATPSPLHGDPAGGQALGPHRAPITPALPPAARRSAPRHRGPLALPPAPRRGLAAPPPRGPARPPSSRPPAPSQAPPAPPPGAGGSERGPPGVSSSTARFVRERGRAPVPAAIPAGRGRAGASPRVVADPSGARPRGSRAPGVAAVKAHSAALGSRRTSFVGSRGLRPIARSHQTQRELRPSTWQVGKTRGGARRKSVLSLRLTASRPPHDACAAAGAGGCPARAGESLLSHWMTQVEEVRAERMHACAGSDQAFPVFLTAGTVLLAYHPWAGRVVCGSAIFLRAG